MIGSAFLVIKVGIKQKTVTRMHLKKEMKAKTKKTQVWISDDNNSDEHLGDEK